MNYDLKIRLKSSVPIVMGIARTVPGLRVKIFVRIAFSF
jgi:hypothetical protein